MKREPKDARPVPYCTYVVAHDNPARPDKLRVCGRPAVWWQSRCHKHITAPEPKEKA